MRLQISLPVALALLIGIAWNAAAQEKDAPKDLHGDPLPAGAVARLGTSRLQHAGAIHALVYSPDGKWLASTGADKTIRIWDAQTGKALQVLAGHEGSVTGLAFAPSLAKDAKALKVLVSTSLDKTVRFWDLTTGKEMQHIINHPGAPTVLAVSPDGKLLATGGPPDAIILWQVEDGKELRRWKAHPGGVAALAFGPEGKTIASAGRAGTEEHGIALWDTATGKVRQTFAGHTSAVWALALSADGKQLISSGIDKAKGRSVLLWDPDTGNQVRALGGRFGGLDARCMALTTDGKTLATADFGGISLIDTAGGAEQRGLPSAIVDRVNALAFSPDGQSLASAGQEGRITVWDVARRTAKFPDHGHMQHITSVAVSPDGKTIATTRNDGVARLWERATSKPLHQLHNKKQGVVVIWCAAFSPDSKIVALAHQRDGITFWDVDKGTLQRRIPDQQSDRIVSVAFSPDGKRLASERDDQTGYFPPSAVGP